MKLCRHHQECGGCTFQDTPYSEQLSAKKDNLIEITGFEDAVIIESPEIFGFRNKMEYTFEGESLGLHPRGRFDQVVNLAECPVFSEWIGDFFENVREFTRKYEVDFYRRREKKGVLRYLICRESKFTGEKMVILVTNGDSFRYEQEWIDMVSSVLPGAASIILARRHMIGDTALTDDYSVLSGTETINMRIGSMEMEMSPYSFFQPNSYLVEKMYNTVRDGIGDGRIMDLFCGVGSITMYIAGKSRRITGVDSFPSCIKNARRNVELLNPPGRIDFIESTVRAFLSAVEEPFDYLVMDPPRGGMSPKVFRHIARIQERFKSIKRIFYICCSLKNLQSDMGLIKEELKWKVKSVTGIDQFVHTPHLETVVELEP